MRFWEWVKKHMSFLNKGKIEAWKTTSKDLDENVKIHGSGRVGSYEATKKEGESFTGIKITFPLPEGKSKDK